MIYIWWDFNHHIFEASINFKSWGHQFLCFFYVLFRKKEKKTKCLCKSVLWYHIELWNSLPPTIFWTIMIIWIHVKFALKLHLRVLQKKLACRFIWHHIPRIMVISFPDLLVVSIHYHPHCSLDNKSLQIRASMLQNQLKVGSENFPIFPPHSNCYGLGGGPCFTDALLTVFTAFFFM